MNLYNLLNFNIANRFKGSLNPSDKKLSYTSVYPKSLRMLIKEYQKILFLLARIAHILLNFFYCKVVK